jgi:hypothetical protein
VFGKWQVFWAVRSLHPNGASHGAKSEELLRFANDRLGCNGSPGSNVLAYFVPLPVAKKENVLYDRRHIVFNVPGSILTSPTKE